MPLYRADPKDGVAWITGASTGIGRQLALDLARQGYVVAATARELEKLSLLTEEAAGLPGRIVAFPCDVTDETGMDRTVRAIEAAHGPIALAIFNAGAYFPTHGERLETYNFVSTFQVNVFGVIFGLVPVADRMRDRRFGHVVIIGSITAYFGLPSAGAYGATKAALNSIAQSLRYDFETLNIRIQIINPGFVATQLTSRNRFRMPALLAVDEASRRIAKGIRDGGFEVSFPRRLSWTMKAGGYLPQELCYRFVRRLTGWDKRRFGVERKKRR